MPTKRDERDGYLLLPAWVRTAGLYLMDPKPAQQKLDHWDLTALTDCIKNCDAFKCDTCGTKKGCTADCRRALAQRLKNVRNAVAHKNLLDWTYSDGLDQLEGIMTGLGVGAAMAQLQLEPYRIGQKRRMPALRGVEEARVYEEGSRAALMKLMTVEQLEKFEELRATPLPCRLLLGAPAGSGKTLIAVKLIADELRNPRMRLPSGARCPPLLLVHTRPLQRHALAELVAELGDEIGECIELRDELGELVYITRLDLTSGACAFVATISRLCVALAGTDAQSEAEVAAALECERPKGGVPRASLGLVVVDEGHHVFSVQPDPALEGQWRFRDAQRVRQVLEHCLAPDVHSLVIFHDHSHQRESSQKPKYPTGLDVHQKNRERFLTRIVRLPAAMRDAAMPFCKDCEKRSTDGRVAFYQLLNEGVHGELICADVPYGRVLSARPHDDAEYLGSLKKKGISTEAEGAAQEPLYVRQLALQLSLLEQLCSSAQLGSKWRCLVAVLMPSGMPAWDAVALRDAMLACSSCERVKEVMADASLDGLDNSQLYLGPVELFAGLDRPFVLVVGFRHPQYVSARLASGATTRVDPAIYQALTRCTYRLVVIDVNVESFMNHYKLREASGDMVAMSAPRSACVGFRVDDSEVPYLRLKVTASFLELALERVMSPWNRFRCSKLTCLSLGRCG